VPSETRKHGGRQWLALHALALMPSALAAAPPSAAAGHARLREETEEAMRWLAELISALKDKASRVMLVHAGRSAGGGDGAQAEPRETGGSSAGATVQRADFDALDAKVERILRLLSEGQGNAGAGGSASGADSGLIDC
jgi:hypothetical protein